MRDRRSAFAVWVVVVLALVPASYVFWWFGGAAMCGEEIYDTPPGSLGDRACEALVDPVAPWLALASLPLVLALVLGALALRRRSSRLFKVALVSPVVLIVGGIFAFLAIF